MTAIKEAIVRVDSLQIDELPRNASPAPWYLIFTVNGEWRGWFHQSVQRGDRYHIGYRFPVHLGDARSVDVHVAGFQEASPEPVVLPPLRCTLELGDGLLAVSKTVPSVASSGTPAYAIDVTAVCADGDAAADAPPAERTAFPVERRHRTMTTLIALALLTLASYGAALFGAMF